MYTNFERMFSHSVTNVLVKCEFLYLEEKIFMSQNSQGSISHYKDGAQHLRYYIFLCSQIHSSHCGISMNGQSVMISQSELCQIHKYEQEHIRFVFISLYL